MFILFLVVLHNVRRHVRATASIMGVKVIPKHPACPLHMFGFAQTAARWT